MYRMMIVDDEASIRQGIADLIRNRCPRWEVVGLARDGLEALKLSGILLPQVILTDITMPHMSGLEFLENLADILPDTKVVVISGYDQFEYAVQSMRLGVSDYLLKPLDTDKLIALLDHFADLLDAEHLQQEKLQALYSRAERADTLELRNYFRSALRGLELPPLRGSEAYQTAGKQFCCVLCVGLEGHTELLDALLGQKTSPAIHRLMLPMEAPAEQAVVFWAPPAETGEFFLTLSQTLSSVAVQLRRDRGLVPKFFIGDIVESAQMLHLSFRSAWKACNYAFPDIAEPVTSYEDVQEDSMLPCAILPNALSTQLLTAVLCENPAAFQHRCEELFGWFRSQQIRDATYVRMCIISLCLSVLSEGSEPTHASYADLATVHDEIMRAQSLEELKRQLESFVRLHWLRRSGVASARPSLAQRVADIVKVRLSDMDFSLNDVARVLFISPNYLRQLFKQETGQTFTEYLTAQRMIRAKLLLGNPGLHISDAAEQCGYADSRYFSVCFKKHWHMTPREYQLSLYLDPDAKKR